MRFYQDSSGVMPFSSHFHFFGEADSFSSKNKNKKHRYNVSYDTWGRSLATYVKCNQLEGKCPSRPLNLDMHTYTCIHKSSKEN